MTKENHKEKGSKSKNHSSSLFSLYGFRYRHRPKSCAEVAAWIVAFQRWKHDIYPLIDKMGNVSIGEPSSSSPNPPLPSADAADAATLSKIGEPSSSSPNPPLPTADAADATTLSKIRPLIRKKVAPKVRNKINYLCIHCETVVKIFKDDDKGYRIWDGVTTKCVPTMKGTSVYCSCGKGVPFFVPSFF